MPEFIKVGEIRISQFEYDHKDWFFQVQGILNKNGIHVAQTSGVGEDHMITFTLIKNTKEHYERI